MIFLALLTELYNHVFYRGEQASIKRGEQAFGEEGTGKQIETGTILGGYLKDEFVTQGPTNIQKDLTLQTPWPHSAKDAPPEFKDLVDEWYDVGVIINIKNSDSSATRNMLVIAALPDDEGAQHIVDCFWMLATTLPCADEVIVPPLWKDAVVGNIVTYKWDPTQETSDPNKMGRRSAYDKGFIWDQPFDVEENHANWHNFLRRHSLKKKCGDQIGSWIPISESNNWEIMQVAHEMFVDGMGWKVGGHRGFGITNIVADDTLHQTQSHANLFQLSAVAMSTWGYKRCVTPQEIGVRRSLALFGKFMQFQRIGHIHVVVAGRKTLCNSFQDLGFERLQQEALVNIDGLL